MHVDIAYQAIRHLVGLRAEVAWVGDQYLSTKTPLQLCLNALICLSRLYFEGTESFLVPIPQGKTPRKCKPKGYGHCLI